MKKFALFISIIFSPIVFFLLMPFLVLYRQTHDTIYAVKWEIFSFLFLILGLLYLFYGRKKGLFSDFDISHREERKLFYYMLWALGVLYLAIAVFVKGIFFPLSIIAAGIIVGFFVFDIVNTRVKASMHMGAATAWVLSINILYTNKIFLLAFLILPLLGWSRIALKRHTIREEIVGASLSATITIATFLIAKELLYNT